MSVETAAPASDATPTTPCKQLEDGVNHLMQGKRHLLVKDYPSAVTSLADACALLAGKYGDLAPECGEPYLYYGRALLELARAEAGVFEMAPPKSDSDEEEEDDSESKEDSDEASKSDEEDADGEAETAKEGEAKAAKDGEAETAKGGEIKAVKDGGAETAKDGEVETAKDGEVETAKDGGAETAKDGGAETAKDGGAETAKDGGAETANDEGEKSAKNGEDKAEETAKNGEAKTENGPGTSNGGPSKSSEDGDEVDDDKDEDGEVNNLQLAWEILEMAKIIYQKQADATNSKETKTRLAEVLLKLGEVGIESENWPTAIDDLKACLAMQIEVLDKDDRRLAETYYQLAVAHSNNNEYEESIDSFEKACNQLKVRIDALEAKRPQEDIINQGLIDSEIKELKQVLVEMKDRLSDTKTEQNEPKDDHDDDVKNGSGSKTVSNIAHLVRKKPKAETSDATVETKTEVKTEGESNADERKRKSEDDDSAAVAALKKAKLEA